jgi:2-phosphoglycerate kinase
LDEIDLVQADHTFFLKVSDEEVRQRRLNKRKKITASDRLLEDEGLRVRMIKEYHRFPCTEIDTTVLNVDQVVETIYAALHNDIPVSVKRLLPLRSKQ